METTVSLFLVCIPPFLLRILVSPLQTFTKQLCIGYVQGWYKPYQIGHMLTASSQRYYYTFSDKLMTKLHFHINTFSHHIIDTCMSSPGEDGFKSGLLTSLCKELLVAQILVLKKS